MPSAAGPYAHTHTHMGHAHTYTHAHALPQRSIEHMYGAGTDATATPADVRVGVASGADNAGDSHLHESHLRHSTGSIANPPASASSTSATSSALSFASPGQEAYAYLPTSFFDNEG